MAGPFQSYAKPDVYTKTLYDASIASLPGNVRIPALIGVGEEILTVTDYEMVRGSSATLDNLIVEEDESSQFDGTNRKFVVTYYPIVSGDGTGTATDDVSKVKVYVDGVLVSIDRMTGSTGEIYLAYPPALGSTVYCTYYHDLLDTLVTDEDVSTQFDGAEVSCTVANRPIVDGTNGGIVTMDPDDVTVTVDDVAVTVEDLNGLTGVITLTSAPSAAQTVLVTYYYNTWDNTADPLPSKDVTEIVSVGYSPGRQNFYENTDYTLIEDEIQWGTCAKITSNTTNHITGSEYIDETQITVTVGGASSGQNGDDWFYYEQLTQTGPASANTFLLGRTPVDGSGLDRSTNDPALIAVFVGPAVDGALLVTANILDAATKTVTLDSTPASGNNVYCTYHWNRLVDDRYTITCRTPGIVGVGDYIVESEELGLLSSIEMTGYTIAGMGTPGFLQYGSPKTTPHYSITETITITFTSSSTFDVTSSENPGGGSFGSGEVYQTYFDTQTGVFFALDVPNTGNYATFDTITLTVAQDGLFTTSTSPNLQIPGTITLVRNMTDVEVGEQAFIDTYDKSGDEPEVGGVYYITYKYTKPASEFDAKLYLPTDFSLIQQKYGAISLRNKITLAASLAFQNGAPALLIKQLVKTTGESDAPAQSYINALTDFKVLVDGVAPAIMLPLTTDSTVLASTQLHCEIMSSMRYQGERTLMCGLPAGTTLANAQAAARARKSNRVLMVYPSSAVIGIVDELGSEIEYTVDSSFIACAVAGYNTSLAIDVATPMTNKNLVGFKRLTVDLDETTKDMASNAGLFVVENNAGALRIRHSRTTDPTNVYTSEPSITTIADTVQQAGRFSLRQFIGDKFLLNKLGMIEDALSATLATLQQQEIIVAFTGVSAKVNATQPDMVDVEAYYSPVFPLNYIQVTFNLRASV